MMDDEEFENELSSDDEDFKPEEADDSVSENSGPDDAEPADSGSEGENSKAKKRKKSRRGRKVEPEPEEEEPKEEPEMSKEEMKQRADALWADFLNDTDDPPPQPKPADPKPQPTSSTSKPPPAASKKIIPEAPVKEIFEFAGETIEVPAKSSEPQKTENATPTRSPAPGLKRPSSSGGGLASMLNQLNKKNKLSVLEKTKLDWDGFKTNTGISEELQTHNRGRDGFLERRDFLERTDLRQFEIEKNLRLTRRK